MQYEQVTPLEKDCLKTALKRNLAKQANRDANGDMRHAYLKSSKGIYSYQDCIEAIENETELGKSLITGIIGLAIYLLEKEAEKEVQGAV
jgi:hypothetical protein